MHFLSLFRVGLGSVNRHTGNLGYTSNDVEKAGHFDKWNEFQ